MKTWSESLVPSQVHSAKLSVGTMEIDPVSAAYQGSSPQSAEVIYKAITVKKPRARYSVVPKPLEAWLLSNLFPTRLIDRIMAKQFGLATTHTNGGRT
jgi:hypothetical protein